MSLSLAQGFAELDVARYKAELYRQWHAGCRAGLLHHRVLETSDAFERSPTVRRLRGALLAGLSARRTITQVVKAQPALFAPFEAALLELGEESGTLEQSLRLLAEHFVAEQRAVGRVKRKLAYPMFNAVAATFIGPFPLLLFGHPGAYLLSVGALLALELAAGGGVLLAVARWYATKPALVRARLARGLATGIEAGLGLDRVVQLGVQASGSPEIAAHLARIPVTVRMGQSLARTFAGCPLIPREMHAAMEVADATGDYRDTLQRLADLYEAGFR